MASDAPLRNMTAQELLQYSHEPYRQELIAGILYEVEPAGGHHGRVAMTIGTLLHVHVRAHDLGLTFAAETGFLLARDPDTVRAPDAAFVARPTDDPRGSDSGYWPGPPDLAIEVVSANDRRSAVTEKALDWLAFGTRAVIVVDSRSRTAEVFRSKHDIRMLGEDEHLDVGDIVPGWSPRVGDFFV